MHVRNKGKHLIAIALSLAGLLSGLVPPGYARSEKERWSVNAGARSSSASQLRTSSFFKDDASSGLQSNSPLVQTARRRAGEAYGKLPLLFEANRGQTSNRVKFISRGQGYSLFLTSNEAVFALRRNGRDVRKDRARMARSSFKASRSTPGGVLSMRLMGANPRPEVSGLDESPSRVNYFISSNPEQWRTGVSTFAKVRYEAIYPGVDMIYYGNQRQLEYDFVVSPDGDAGKINLAYKGASRVWIDSQGELVLRMSNGDEVRQRKPMAYQEVNGARREIASRYVMKGKNRVGFRLGLYDRSLPLVIDPVLVYSTYLGGGVSGSPNSSFPNANDSGSSITVDSNGNTYIVGTANSANFPTANAFQPSGGSDGLNEIADVFITKLNAAGNALIFSTYLGGTGRDTGRAIGLDSSGNIYICGETTSMDNPNTPQNEGFPVANAVQPTWRLGGPDGFVTKLNSTGSALIYSTYLGGNEGDVCNDIAVDNNGNAYVTGSTSSADFPTLNAFQSQIGTPNTCAFIPCHNSNAFVTKFNASGGLSYSTYLGGSVSDIAYSIAVDSSDNAYVTGSTNSPNFPKANAMQSTFGNSGSPFVSKLNASGSGLVYSTYLGRLGTGFGITVDSAGNVYVTGQTQAPDFPLVNPFQSQMTGTPDNHGLKPVDTFVSKFNASGSALVYSTYLGGSLDDVGNSIAVDSSGNAYVTGSTGSSDFPTVNSLQAYGGGFNDAFITKFNPTGNTLAYSTYLGGGGSDLVRGGNSIAVDASASAYVTGTTTSTNFPVTQGAFQTSNAGGSCVGGPCSDAFIAMIRDSEPTPTPSPTPQWQPVVLTVQQIAQIKAWTVGGRTYVYVKPQFPDAGYRVVNWGQVVRSGNDFTVDASVERFTGASIQAVVTTAQIYDLGPLADGTYNFNFKTSGTLAKTLQFTVSSAIPPPNPIDNAREFVKQQYRDFLNREADQAGEDFWTDNITKCSDPARRPPSQTEAECISRQRETTSAAFFISPEFQNTGYFVLRVYRGSLNRMPFFGGSVPADPNKDEFTRDHAAVSTGIVVNNQLDAGVINANKQAFANQFVTRAEFRAIYDSLNNDQYVDRLFLTTGVAPTAAERSALVNGLNAPTPTETRASVLFKIVDGTQTGASGGLTFQTRFGQAFYDQQFKPAFVQMEYFGYMKRDPDDAGYAFWLDKLNSFPSFVEAQMVLAFISSPEYRARFGQP